MVGRSIAGEELSSVGSRHPEKVSGLIYLDAAYSCAFYDRERGDCELDWKDIQKKVEQIKGAPAASPSVIQELLDTSLPAFERDLRDVQKAWGAMAEASQPAPRSIPGLLAAVMAGGHKYTNIPMPILAIFAIPQAIRRR
jgi:hypothetical protein